MSLFDAAPRLGLGGHQSAAMESDEWLTPPYVIAALGGTESFDLDPCAPVRRPWPMAKRHYTVEDNGLLKPWSGRVWLNPPYGGPSIIGPWLRYMAGHGHGIALTFARTETDLFHETVWQKAAAVLFLRGRLFFHHVDGRMAANNAGAPSVLAAYGSADAESLRSSGLSGAFVRLR